MRTKLIEKLWLVICLATVLTACNDDDYEGPAPYEVNTTYSNLLANGDNPTLVLTYDGADMIGKNVYFRMEDARTGMLSMERVIPGEAETNIAGIALAAADNKYSFSGSATGSTGATFQYEGSVEKGKLALALNNVKIPANSLSNQGMWNPTTLDAYKDMSSLTGMILSVIAYPALQTVINTTVDQITFEPDGNIIAHYAGLPEGVGFADLISGKVQPRPEDEWKNSPKSMATYCVKSDTLLYIYPNVDGIIRQVQSGNGRAASLPILSIIQVYTKLNAWATTGIKLVIRENANASGDSLVVLNKDEVRALFEIIKILGDLLPEETLNAKAVDWLSGIVPEQFQGMLSLFLKDMTVSQLIDQVYTDLDAMPFHIGLYLSK
jgi:hypothetical protein